MLNEYSIATNQLAYLSSETLITPSSPFIKIAELISSPVPSNLLNNSGLFMVLKRSFAFRGAGFISAAIISMIHQQIIQFSEIVFFSL